MPERGRRPLALLLTEGLWPLLVLMALTCIVSLVTFALGPDSLDRVVLGSVIDLTVVVGLYTFVGVSGVFSFGHAAFMAIGAYTSAILVIPPETKQFVLPDLPGFLASAQLDPLPATVVAGALAAVFALVLSLPLARLSGLTAGLATFAVLSIVNIVARNWEQVTHGTAGVSGNPDDDDDLGSARLGHGGDGGSLGVSALARRAPIEGLARERVRRSLDRCCRRP